MTARAFVSLTRDLRELADRARRLPPPSHIRPHSFYEAKDELACALERAALKLAELTGTRPADPFRPLAFVARRSVDL